MRTAPLARTKPLARRKALEQRTPLPRVNRKRRARLHKVRYGNHADWIRTHTCLICGHLPTEAHHHPTKAAGGTAKDLTPLCRKHHQLYHVDGPETFQRDHDIDLAAEAAELWAISPARR